MDYSASLLAPSFSARAEASLVWVTAGQYLLASHLLTPWASISDMSVVIRRINLTDHLSFTSKFCFVELSLIAPEGDCTEMPARSVQGSSNFRDDDFTARDLDYEVTMMTRSSDGEKPMIISVDCSCTCVVNYLLAFFIRKTRSELHSRCRVDA